MPDKTPAERCPCCNGTGIYREMTPEEAQEAYDNATPVPLSAELIEEIVKYVTSTPAERAAEEIFAKAVEEATTWEYDMYQCPARDVLVPIIQRAIDEALAEFREAVAKVIDWRGPA